MRILIRILGFFLITETEAVDAPSLELYVDEKEGFKLLRPALWNKVNESDKFTSRVPWFELFRASTSTSMRFDTCLGFDTEAVVCTSAPKFTHFIDGAILYLTVLV